MFDRARPVVAIMWFWFRSKSKFVQLILVVPILCALVLTVLVGNMGLALMGFAYALYAPIVGWVGGLFIIILAKATTIIHRDRQKSRNL